MAMTAAERASRRVPTILFDLDGTLIDSIELILNSARHAFEKLGRDCPGYFFAVGNHIPPEVPVENLVYYFDLCQELGRR
jgi:phosphoglycolate phosphatase-like HAD superfamily hydrolase